MSSVDRLDPLRLPGGIVTSATVSFDGRFVAVIFENAKSRIQIFSCNDGSLISTIRIPGFNSDQPPNSLVVTCAWTEDSLLVASSYGHVFFVPVSTWTVVPIRMKVRLLSTDFSKIAVHKNEVAVLVSSQDILMLSKNSGGWDTFAGRSTFPLSPDQPDQVLSLDVHPSGAAIAVCLRDRKKLVLVALKGGNPELFSQLRRTPKDSEFEDVQEEFETPIEEDSLECIVPSIVNEFGLGTGRVPVACAWSKYGDNLVIASSDNLLSIWNVPSRTITTVAVSEKTDIFIRNVKFLNDVLVAVAVSDSNRVMFVDVDEGLLYETECMEDGNIDRTKNTCIDFSFSKGGSKVSIFRPASSHGVLNRWTLSL